MSDARKSDNKSEQGDDNVLQFDESLSTKIESGLVISYSLAFDTVAWLFSYLDYHQEIMKLDEFADSDLLDKETFAQLAKKNHLEVNQSQFITEQGVGDLQGSLPLIVIGENQAAYVVLEQTINHWRIFDIKQRAERYFSADELIALKPLAEFHVALDKPKEDTVELKTGFWNNWLVKEVFKHKRIYRDALMASVIINMVALFIPLYTMNVYDKVVPNLAFDTLWVLTIIIIIGLVFDWVLKTARSMLTDTVGQHIDTVLSTKILRRVLSSQSENAPNSIGVFAKQFQDFDGVRDFLNSITISTLVDLPFTILFLSIIYIIGGPLVLAPLTIMLLMSGITLAIQPKIAHNIENLSSLKSERGGLSFEALQQMDTLKLNNGKQWMLSRWQKSVDQCAKASFHSNKLTNKLNHTTQFLQQWMTIAVVVTGVYLISERELTMGALIAVTMVSGRTVGGVMQLATLITRWQQAKEGINSVNNLLSLPPERSDDEVQIERRYFLGDVKFHNVSFKYPETEAYALHNLNLTIKPGERVALLGGIGAGKTTFIKLLQSLYLPTSGRLLYDNLEAKFWDVDLLRKHIASCEQHPRLLKETIFQNIAINSDGVVLEHHLVNAIKQSGLDGVLPKIEGGLEKKVGEGNVGLSGGQTQSVALARAFYKRANLLILDEPTSMMDKKTELKVLRSLKELPKTTTLILSTHNLTLLEAVDRVIVFDQGRIKYDGSAQQLRKKETA